MSAQLTYTATPDIGQPGMIAQEFALRQVDSYLAQGECFFGYAMVQGTAVNQVKPATAFADKFVGIVVAELNEPQLANTVIASYADKEALPVLKYGRIYVLAGEAVVVGDPVFCGATTAGERGKFYNDAATSTRIDCKGRWLTSTASGAVGLIEIAWTAA
jgi:hypothetical protein